MHRMHCSAARLLLASSLADSASAPSVAQARLHRAAAADGLDGRMRVFLQVTPVDSAAVYATLPRWVTAGKTTAAIRTIRDRTAPIVRNVTGTQTETVSLAGAGSGEPRSGPGSWLEPRASGVAASVGVCVVRDGALSEVPAEYDPRTGDTIVAGRPFAEVYPASTPPYAAGADWYASGGMVVFERRRYVRYGLPRVVPADSLRRVGEFRGIPLFAEDASAAFRFVYVPVRPGCEFQPYWFAATVGEVRGE